MSGRGPTLAELLAANPAAREMLDAHCDAAETVSGAPFRCALRKGHEGSHYDALLQFAWESRASQPSGPVHDERTTEKK